MGIPTEASGRPTIGINIKFQHNLCFACESLTRLLAQFK